MTFFMALTPPERLADAVPTHRTRRGLLEQAIVLKDGFSLPAFLLTGIWLLYKRLWWPLAVFILAWLVAGFALPRLGLHETAIALVQIIIGLFVGHEGHAMIERKLVRNGWQLAGVVEANDIDTAERRFFEQALASSPATPLPMGATAPGQIQRASTTPIIGLFPEATRR
jgi:hypothetical protein